MQSLLRREREIEMESKVELIQHTIQKLMEEEVEDEGNKVIMSSSSKSFPGVADGEFYKEVEEDSDRRRRRRLVLTGLLSQLDTIEAAEKLEQCDLLCDATIASRGGGKVENIDEASSSMENEEIAQELKRVRRQNFITHCLLGIMIVLTVGWQISQVSLLWMVRDGIKHPFRSMGSMLKGILQRPNTNDLNGEVQSLTKDRLYCTKEKLMEAIKHSSTREKLIEALESLRQSSTGEKLIEALEAVEGSSLQGFKMPKASSNGILQSFNLSNDEE